MSAPNRMGYEPADVWLAVDWGTSNLRLWVMTSDKAIVASLGSDQGMGRLAPQEFEPALLALAEPYLQAGRCRPVVICGMAGARQGWVEAPYQQVPCAPVGQGLQEVVCQDPRLCVSILPGLSQEAPYDVMRGEETQIAGFLSCEPDFGGLVCMPGSHTKWVTLKRGLVQHFTTALTGELFSLLASQSILRHSMSDGWHEPSFLAGLEEGFDQPEKLTTSLFAIRAQSLLAASEPAQGGQSARLSGLLIGQELAALSKVWQQHNLVVIGSQDLAATYARALEHLGQPVRQLQGDVMALAGLCQAYERLQEQRTAGAQR